jgi:ubiquinone/menaquinone biosynthesis C-methylase UbiE
MRHEGVCPFWVGYFLICPIRKWFENPKKILSAYVTEGMNVLDAGCAMGFFSLPLSKMVGPKGKVVCVDVQDKMIDKLRKRAGKPGLLDRIETRVCTSGSLGIDDLRDKIDFALASAVIHEVPEPSSFFSEIYKSLKRGGRFLIIEPKGRVTAENFEETISLAGNCGLKTIERTIIRGSRSVLLEKSVKNG